MSSFRPMYKSGLMRKNTFQAMLMMLLMACSNGENAKTSEANQIEPTGESKSTATKEEEDPVVQKEPDLLTSELHDTTFIFLEEWSSRFAYEMKYATTDNFIKQKVYECDQCMIRKEVAIALIKASEEFEAIGYRIKFFDCYRPLDVQKIMWEVYPVEGYVANPYTSGSIHNRGGAVDITLVDENGKELDMGTNFDFFGIQAHHSYKDLPGKVLENRQVLKSVMEKHGFKSIKTEWWHYNFGKAKKYALSNFPTECN